ncbi:MAG: hypothetical protein ACXWP5_06100 [Bdellovibrionota bacterium]
MNSLYLLSMVLTVVANIAYHLCQRGIAGNVNPLLSLIVTYVTSLAVTIPAYALFYGNEPIRASLGKLNWASFGLGLALVGLELGFLLVYRAGWKISVAALYSNLLVTLLLIPIGLLAYQDGFTARKGVGVLLAVSGLWALAGV